MTTLWRVGSVLLLALVLGDFDWASRAVGQVTAEKPLDAKSERHPVEYQPYLGNLTKQKLIPWEGEKVVLLTTTADFDLKSINLILKRLDAAWTLCGDLTGYVPPLSRQFQGKPTIAAVPGSKGFSLKSYGDITKGGGEVYVFYGADGDYELLRQSPEQFPLHYFQVIAQNHNGMANSCLCFNIGSQRALSLICAEGIKLNDADAMSRQSFEQLANAKIEFFDDNNPQLVRRRDESGTLLPASDLGMFLGSIALKLRQERGGNEWFKRFYRHLSATPHAVGVDRAHINAQLLNFTIAASLASQSDPSKDFQTRWGFQFDPAVWAALKKVDWKKPGLTPMDVIDALLRTRASQDKKF